MESYTRKCLKTEKTTENCVYYSERIQHAYYDEVVSGHLGINHTIT